MISIIVCSINIEYFKGLKKSIENTIGSIEYEIIRIGNLQEKLPITKAYNLGISKSKYNFLVFVHEDVLFHTINWGNILLEVFKSDKKIGLIGVAGAKYKSKVPSAFWHTKEELLNIHLIQHNKEKGTSLLLKGFANKIEDVVVIDGVFIALDKSKGIVFNEKLKGFHCYDMSISLDMLKNKFKVKVLNQILIEHFSIGNTNTSFVKSVLIFHELYKSELPASVTHLNVSTLEIVALGKFLQVCLINRFIPYSLWFKFFIRRPFNRLNYNFLKLIIYKLIKE